MPSPTYSCCSEFDTQYILYYFVQRHFATICTQYCIVDISRQLHTLTLKRKYPSTSSGTLKIERLESQIIYSFGSKRTKGLNNDRQNQLRSLMLEGGEP